MDDGRVFWAFPEDMKKVQGENYRAVFDFATATVLVNFLRRGHPEWMPRVEGYFDVVRVVGIWVLILLCVLGIGPLAEILHIDLAFWLSSTPES